MAMPPGGQTENGRPTLTNSDRTNSRLRVLLRVAAAALVLLLDPQSSQGQDTQYWNIQYGTRSTLLGGAVIGSVSDLSATYYNPGAIGLSRASGLILSTGVYEGNSLKLDGTGIAKREISSFGVNVAPSLVAGRFPADSGAADRLAYSLLTRQRANLQLQWRFVGAQESIRGVRGSGSVSQEATMLQDMSEIWGGFTWARSVSRSVGIGVTTYFALRTQEKGMDLSAYALTDSSGVAGLKYEANYDYYNVRVLWKAGLAIDLSPLSLGLTITTPSLNLFGSGSAYANMQSSGVDANGDGVPDPLFVADYQEDLSSVYGTPWALGMGVSYQLGQFRFDVSAEWYAAVSRFNVLEPGTFAGQSTGVQYQNNFSAALNPVLNFGAGIEWDANEHTSWYASVITDNSGLAVGSGTNFAVSSLDYINVTGGGIFSIGRAKTTLGLGYAFGSSLVSLSDNPILNAAVGGSYSVATDTKLTSTRLRLIFAFSYTI
jgi:hypothetical protein